MSTQLFLFFRLFSDYKDTLKYWNTPHAHHHTITATLDLELSWIFYKTISIVTTLRIRIRPCPIHFFLFIGAILESNVRFLQLLIRLWETVNCRCLKTMIVMWLSQHSLLCFSLILGQWSLCLSDFLFSLGKIYTHVSWPGCFAC